LSSYFSASRRTPSCAVPEADAAASSASMASMAASPEVVFVFSERGGRAAVGVRSPPRATSSAASASDPNASRKGTFVGTGSFESKVDRVVSDGRSASVFAEPPPPPPPSPSPSSESSSLLLVSSPVPISEPVTRAGAASDCDASALARATSAPAVGADAPGPPRTGSSARGAASGFAPPMGGRGASCCGFRSGGKDVKGLALATGAAAALAGAGMSFPGVPRSSSSSTSTSRSSRSSIARPRVVERRKVPRGVIARVVNGKFRCPKRHDDAFSRDANCRVRRKRTRKKRERTDLI